MQKHGYQYFKSLCLWQFSCSIQIFFRDFHVKQNLCVVLAAGPTTHRPQQDHRLLPQRVTAISTQRKKFPHARDTPVLMPYLKIHNRFYDMYDIHSATAFTLNVYILLLPILQDYFICRCWCRAFLFVRL